MSNSNREAVFRLWIIGSFRLEKPDGTRVEISSKRGQALLAMLALSGSGERSRTWIQDRLWGSRAPDQAAASLRRELSNLRQLINSEDDVLLGTAHGRVWLDLSLVEVDCRQLDQTSPDEILEGIDIAGEEAFEDWLRDERARARERGLNAQVQPTPPPNIRSSAPDMSLSHGAIAVLPFSHDGSHKFAAHGLAEDLIDRLARLRWLPVISRSSSFSHMATPVSQRALGEMLGARYLVEGSLRDTTLSVSLDDIETGICLWSNRSKLPASLDHEISDAILNAITAALGFRVDLSEQQRALGKAKSDLSVRDLIWRGRWHLNRLSSVDADLAKGYFEEALSRDPSSPEALIQVTWARLWDLWRTRASQEDIREVRKMAQRAIIADYDDARGHMLAGIAEIWLRQPLRAEALLKRAVELNPSLVMAHAQLGAALHLKGEHHAAIASLATAITLSPNDQDLFFMQGELAMAHLFVGEFEEAIREAEHAIVRRQGYWIAHVAKVIALAKLGRPDEAKAGLAELRALDPNFSTSYIDWLPFVDASKRDFLQEPLNLL